jgi:Hemocyanin, ig-like domain
MKHLQHEDFTYQIKVDNTSGFVQELVFRIFMAPVKDQTGRNFTLREQRQLMIEMDKFVKKGHSFNFYFTGETE